MAFTTDCYRALDVFAQHHLSHNVGLLDALIGQTAIALGVPLCTFNHRHCQFIPGLQTTQPYEKTAQSRS
jgi:predicted nucleic acid-binding protein